MYVRTWDEVKGRVGEEGERRNGVSVGCTKGHLTKSMGPSPNETGNGRRGAPHTASRKRCSQGPQRMEIVGKGTRRADWPPSHGTGIRRGEGSAGRAHGQSGAKDRQAMLSGDRGLCKPVLFHQRHELNAVETTDEYAASCRC